jgi:hypothetical protein
MSKYNGHKNWNHWNVSLWLNNDENFYHMMKEFRDQSARYTASKNMLSWLHDCGMQATPDGAPYSISSIRAAMTE